jgi:hypothetical protein
MAALLSSIAKIGMSPSQRNPKSIPPEPQNKLTIGIRRFVVHCVTMGVTPFFLAILFAIPSSRLS